MQLRGGQLWVGSLDGSTRYFSADEDGIHVGNSSWIVSTNSHLVSGVINSGEVHRGSGIAEWQAVLVANNNSNLITQLAGIEAAIDAVVPADYAAEDVSISDLGGYFTGTDVEAALQEIMNLGATDDQVAGEVGYTDTYGIGETDLQGALDYVINIGATDDQNASEVAYTDTETIGETDVQGAIDYILQTGSTDNQVASEVGYTDTHTIGATDVQGAIDILAAGGATDDQDASEVNTVLALTGNLASANGGTVDDAIQVVDGLTLGTDDQDASEVNIVSAMSGNLLGANGGTLDDAMVILDALVLGSDDQDATEVTVIDSGARFASGTKTVENILAEIHDEVIRGYLATQDLDMDGNDLRRVATITDPAGDVVYDLVNRRFDNATLTDFHQMSIAISNDVNIGGSIYLGTTKTNLTEQKMADWDAAIIGGGTDDQTLAEVLSQGADAEGRTITGLYDMSGTGTVTAAAFVGDGSGLTDLPAATYLAGTAVGIDASGFGAGNLTTGETNVQLLAQAVEDLTLGGVDTAANYAWTGIHVFNSTAGDTYNTNYYTDLTETPVIGAENKSYTRGATLLTLRSATQGDLGTNDFMVSSVAGSTHSRFVLGQGVRAAGDPDSATTRDDIYMSGDGKSGTRGVYLDLLSGDSDVGFNIGEKYYYSGSDTTPNLYMEFAYTYGGSGAFDWNHEKLDIDFIVEDDTGVALAVDAGLGEVQIYGHGVTGVLDSADADADVDDMLITPAKVQDMITDAGGLSAASDVDWTGTHTFGSGGDSWEIHMPDGDSITERYGHLRQIRDAMDDNYDAGSDWAHSNIVRTVAYRKPQGNNVTNAYVESINGYYASSMQCVRGINTILHTANNFRCLDGGDGSLSGKMWEYHQSGSGGGQFTYYGAVDGSGLINTFWQVFKMQSTSSSDSRVDVGEDGGATRFRVMGDGDELIDAMPANYTGRSQDHIGLGVTPTDGGAFVQVDGEVQATQFWFPQGDYLIGDGTNLFYVTADGAITNALTSN
jgi:hypothetical protein